MYVGNLLIAGGLAIVSNSWTVIAVAVPLSLFMYGSIVAAEEKYLGRHFGAQFESVLSGRAAMAALATGFGTTLSSMQFRWRRVLLKEYGTPFGWISVLVLMTLYNFWMSGQWQARARDIHSLEKLLGVTFVLWLAALLLKRSRWIKAD